MNIPHPIESSSTLRAEVAALRRDLHRVSDMAMRAWMAAQMAGSHTVTLGVSQTNVSVLNFSTSVSMPPPSPVRRSYSDARSLAHSAGGIVNTAERMAIAAQSAAQDIEADTPASEVVGQLVARGALAGVGVVGETSGIRSAMNMIFALQNGLSIEQANQDLSLGIENFTKEFLDAVSPSIAHTRKRKTLDQEMRQALEASRSMETATSLFIANLSRDGSEYERIMHALRDEIRIMYRNNESIAKHRSDNESFLPTGEGR